MNGLDGSTDIAGLGKGTQSNVLLPCKSYGFRYTISEYFLFFFFVFFFV